jgi:hypothetical protein
MNLPVFDQKTRVRYKSYLFVEKEAFLEDVFETKSYKYDLCLMNGSTGAIETTDQMFIAVSLFPLLSNSCSNIQC